MLVLFGLALVFIMICLVLGSFFSRLISKWLRDSQPPSTVLLNFLTGFIITGTFCNVWSLFAPVGMGCLLVLVLSSLVLLFNDGVFAVFSVVRQRIVTLFTPAMLLLTLPLAIVVVLYAVLIPQHGDSPGYHYASIRWINEYPVVPGLANLQGRFGFNSSFFTTSAAFSLAGFTGQAIYPLNIAFAVAFFGWLLNRIYLHRNNWAAVLYVLILLLMIRGVILTISSPTPDIVVTIIQFFVLVDVGERLLNRKAMTQHYRLQIILLILFAITVKLSVVFLLPVVLLMLSDKKMWRNIKVWTVLVIAGTLILGPWLTRNYILTGYLAYPLVFTGFLHPDWQVPLQVLRFDKLLINNGPKLVGSNWEVIDKLPFYKWFPLWLEAHGVNALLGSLAILLTSIVSMMFGLVKALRSKQRLMLALLCVNKTALAVWLVTSPDYRFAYGYIVAGIALGGLLCVKTKQIPVAVLPGTKFLFLVGCAYYIHFGNGLHKDYQLARYWLQPMPPKEYRVKNNLATFKQLPLGHGLYMYVEDFEHDCNNVELPCFPIFFQRLRPEWIQLRGQTIGEGFRMEKGRLD